MSNPSEKTVQEVKEKKKRNQSKGSKSLKSRNTVNFTKSIEFVEKKAKEILIEKIKANIVKDLTELLTTL